MVEFLKYGPLGVAALLSVVVLGWNVWKLYDLLGKAETDTARLNAARPLLYAQIGASMIGFLLVGGGAMWLAKDDIDNKRTRSAQVLIDPWDAPDAARAPAIRVGAASHDWQKRTIKIECPAGSELDVEINLKPYLDYREAEAVRRASIVRQTLERPQVDDSDV